MMSENRPNEKQYWLDQPGNVKLILRALYITCAGLFIADFFYHRHVDQPMEKIFGFYGIYGFVSCVILVLAAKEMRKLLIRNPDYYDSAEDGAPGGNVDGSDESSAGASGSAGAREREKSGGGAP